MNKPKKTDYKKLLVRNTEKPVPKCTVVSDECKSTGTSRKSTPKSPTNSKTNVKSDPTKFDCPELFSTLKLSKKIDAIVKPRKTKSLSDVDKNNALAIDEKVTRKVNFPYDQPIYKGLIPLTTGKTHSQPTFPIRPPLPQKDKEPLLSDYISPRKIESYFYMPQVKLECEPFITCGNNLRLYSILQKNNEI